MSLTEKQRATRNLNPHAEAVLAMAIWSEDYAFKQRGGSMDFWDDLPDWKKKHCRQLVERIKKTESAVWRTTLTKPDREAGSPKAGDMIARNPKNHADMWLVAAQYFADNFEPV